MRRSLASILEGFPAVRPADPVAFAGLAGRLGAARRMLVVLDDDPTGTQSVVDLPVLARWRVEDLEWAIDSGAPAAYVLTNSRALEARAAEQVNREVVAAAVTAGRSRGVGIAFVSRSDSTLRGHFPLEPDVISDALVEAGEPRPSGVVLVPAFPEAGRVTVGGVHYAGARDGYAPVGESEFARDPTFGYRSSRLADWVEERSGGGISAASVVEIGLETNRSGPEAVAEALRAAGDGSTIVVDAVEEDDLRQFALGLDLVEAEGRSYVYRVGPPFVRARIGQERREPLDAAEFADPVSGGGSRGLPASRGGLVVVGSHVGLTSRQLEHLVAQRPEARVVELDVPAVLDPATARDALDEATLAVVRGLEEGDAILHSSRTLIRADDPEESLAISRAVSDALVQIVRRAVALTRPRFVVAKGGITSSDVATRGLSIARAVVRGSLFPGIVSLWEPADGPAQGIPYVVFAGNVGAEATLAEAVEKLSER
ncbi:hypothetical protein JD276_10965 [Leucobacter sp. CSA1]|uniref:Hydroxyacid dehydrogenase n=1 Tax=Leucobacter chromiisoli TaxID=2796471 RepID=A0A934UV58_9MICO|nr:four-carbon acid sugar kinase family protein [Leucobacter chromiisoli]MBK0419555.1 hypothetical protein [Leucobacter chromiisoli]